MIDFCPIPCMINPNLIGFYILPAIVLYFLRGVIWVTLILASLLKNTIVYILIVFFEVVGFLFSIIS